MGWCFHCDPSRVQGYAGEKAEIISLCTSDNDDFQQEPLQVSKVGSTWYAAVKTTPKKGQVVNPWPFKAGDDGSYIFAAIFLVKYHEGCFGYKSMDETMGPCESRAPNSVLKHLSDLIDEKNDSIIWAQKWRKGCRDYGSIPSYKIGDVIELGSPIERTDGPDIKTVRKASHVYRGKNRTYYVDVDTGKHWRLTRSHLTGSRLVQTAVSAGSPVLAEFEARRADAARS